MSDKESDKIDSVISGDFDAFIYFVQTYKNMAFNIALSIIRDEQGAEDVTQNAFISAFKGLKNFKKKSTFKTWFYKIVVNESRQYLSKNKRNIKTVDLDELSDDALVIEAQTTIESNRDLSTIMQLLPGNEALALNLFYMDGCSLKEIQDITGWSLANAKVILHRARSSLRRALEISESKLHE